MNATRLDRTKIQIYQKGEEPDDVFYWLSRPPAERIQALEAIRKEYNDWKYGPERRFQRVYRIVKRKRSLIPRSWWLCRCLLWLPEIY